MGVNVFYNPEIVAQLETCGIHARRRPGERATGFALTINGRQRQFPSGSGQAEATAPEPKTALELVEENVRLRAEVDRLRAEVGRLTAEARTHAAPERASIEQDDSARRFALLELDL